MRILLLLVPISLVLLGIAIWAFVWAVRRGQFDDLDTPALDILADDEDDMREARSGRPGQGPSSPRRRRAGPGVVPSEDLETLDDPRFAPLESASRLRADDDPASVLPEATATTQRDQGAGPRDAG